MHRCRVGQMSLLGVVTFSALYSFEIFRRRFAKLILKAFAEVSHGAHANHETNLLDGEFAFEQQMFGSVSKSVSGRNPKKGPAKILTGPNKFVILGDKT